MPSRPASARGGSRAARLLLLVRQPGPKRGHGGIHRKATGAMERHVVTFRELANSLRSLGISHEHPVIAHASLSAFGAVSGGAEVVVGAMLAVFDRVMMPAFTYKTMLTPEAGPPDNGLDYGSQRDLNRRRNSSSLTCPATG